METKKTEFDSVVVHYDEIGLKGNNRPYFEDLLIKNILIKLGKLADAIKKESGQITINITKENSKAEDILSRIPGIAFFSFAKKCDLDFESIKSIVMGLLEYKEFSTFKIDAKRHDKNNKFNSMELNCTLGEEVVKKYNKKVQMKNPDLAVKVEITNKHAYVSLGEIEGVGGMPTNEKQKVVALISGGFDSPVASYLMMKRGCEVVYVHFQNKNQMSSSVEDKIIRLAKQLSRYQIKTRLYMLPFEELQKEIIMKVRSTMRMLVYRRFMIKVASKIADIEKARFLVVGDSLAQVASQTFENLNATYEGSEKHIFSPLIGMDKKEIIAIARRIGTYEISALPYGDCCSYFLPKHPELKANANMLKNMESEFNADNLIEEAIKKARVDEV